MKIHVPLKNGFLQDKYAHNASPEFKLEGRPIVSFPIEIEDAPAKTVTFALSLIDFDAIPVCGFAWIHWIAANIPTEMNHLPENASRELNNFIQGKNSAAGSLIGGDEKINHNYLGPQPPVGVHNYTLTVYALDDELPLSNGFWFNEMLEVMKEHVLAKAKIEIPYES